MANIPEFARKLELVGLSEKQAEVYLALLSTGSGTAYEVAQHCDVKKPTVYLVLEELRKKGLVLKVPHAKKALYAARDIAEYLDEREHELASVRRLVPQLAALASKDEPNVFFYSGITGIKQAAMHKFEAMRGKMFRGFYSNLADAPKELLAFYERWDREAVTNGISFDIIMAKRDSGKFYDGIIELAKRHENVHIRFLEEFDYPTNQTIDMGVDFIRIVDEKRLTATVIDDPNTANAFRAIFDIAWRTDK